MPSLDIENNYRSINDQAPNPESGNLALRRIFFASATFSGNKVSLAAMREKRPWQVRREQKRKNLQN
jgi:hypothetical protein